MPHQVAGVKFLASRQYGILNYATGSGKTLIAILTGFYLCQKQNINKFIMVTPKSGIVSALDDYETFTDETPEFLKTYDDIVAFLNGDKKLAVANYNILKQCTEVKEVKRIRKGETVWVLEDVLKSEIIQLFEMNETAIIFDEFHTLKNPKSAITGLWEKVRPYLRRVYGITASSYFKDLYDIYYLVKFLDKKFFGTLKKFRDDYMLIHYKKLWGQKRDIPQILGYKNLNVLKDNLNKIMKVYTPTLDVQYHKHTVKLFDRKDYLEAGKGLLGVKQEKQLYEGFKVKKNYSARLPDLQRVVNHDSNKKGLFTTLVSQYKDGGFIVYTAQKTETLPIIKQMLDDMGVEYKAITGEVTSVKKRREYKNWFNEDPRGKALILTDAGGQSLNLHSVNNLICYDLPFGIGRFIQLRGRIVREVSKHDKFHIHILCGEKTVDEYKYTKITQCEEVYDSLFGLSVAGEDANFTSLEGWIIDELKDNLLWQKG
jgi:superfamily II DNA or RNA helicase